jgi:hypothetical protein
MPILTTSTGRKLYVLRRISTGEIIKRNTIYPVAVDDAPIEGFDADLEFLAIDQDVQPDYDGRIYSLVTNEAKDAVANTWRITFSTQKRVNTEIKVAVTNVEAFENQRHYTSQERDKLMWLAIGVTLRQLANQTLTAKELAVKQRAMELVTTIWKNDDRARALFTAVDAGQEINPDAGWEPVA